MKLKKLMIWMAGLILLALFVNAWAGIPPNPLKFYGPAVVNASNVQIGDVVSVHEIDDGDQQLVNVTVTIAGWYPSIEIPWDNPDTPDEGLTYSYPAKLGFKINGEWVQYISSSSSSVTGGGWSSGKGYMTVDNNQIEGIPTQVNLTYLYNFPPALYFIENKTIAQDSLLSFYIYTIDNNSYRNDTLTFSENSSGSLSGTARIYPGNNTWRTNFSWTPNWNHACTGSYDVTYSVTDDGLPSKSDLQVARINITNVNDPPDISNGQVEVMVNTPRTIDLKNALSYVDHDECFGDAHTFALINSSNLTSGTNFTITDNATKPIIIK